MEDEIKKLQGEFPAILTGFDYQYEGVDSRGILTHDLFTFKFKLIHNCTVLEKECYVYGSEINGFLQYLRKKKLNELKDFIWYINFTGDPDAVLTACNLSIKA